MTGVTVTLYEIIYYARQTAEGCKWLFFLTVTLLFGGNHTYTFHNTF